VRKLLPSLLALALAFPAAQARAQPAGRPGGEAPPAGPADLNRARDLFVEGSKLAEGGDWEGARDRFERSLKLKRAALTLYNLGIAQQETGHLVAALESYRAFLGQPVEPATAGYVEPVRTVVSVLEARVPRVDVDVRPPGLPGLVLRIDGRQVPATQGPRPLDPGHHDFAAAAPGFHDAYQTTTLAEGSRTAVVLRILPVVPGPPSPGVPIALAVSGAALLVGGAVTLGVGAGEGLRSPSQSGSAPTMVVGGAVEGAGAIALGAAAVWLLTRGRADPQKAAVVPWSAGPVGGVRVRF